jgi:hypothetical protein
MTTHLGVMLLFAFMISVVFATLLHDEVRDQVRFGARIFSGLVAGSYVLGWIMFVVFR